jgi:hypothetical protein
MMFKKRRIRYHDPFQLSALGWCRAAIAWLRGPALMRRWLLLVLGASCAVSVGGVIAIALVMHAASPAQPRAASGSPGQDVASQMRVGPASSEVTDLPGYDCHPMPGLGLKYLNPLVVGPSVVAVDRDGVVWGPTCVVTYGIAE